MGSVEHSEKFRIDQPIEIVFSLFSAEGEKLWVPGWDYINVMEANELHEDDVFLTGNHDHATTDAIWLTKRYEPKSHLVQFYKVEPEDKVGIITVHRTRLEKCLTEVIRWSRLLKPMNMLNKVIKRGMWLYPLLMIINTDTYVKVSGYLFKNKNE